MQCCGQLEASTTPSGDTTNSSEKSLAWPSLSASRRLSSQVKSRASPSASSASQVQWERVQFCNRRTRVCAMPSKIFSTSGSESRFSQQDQPMASLPVRPNHGSQRRSADDSAMPLL
ncbi:hypothetical protein D3C86_1657260 [compost metagenome]